jgi:preprotein translocase subunit SecY
MNKFITTLKNIWSIEELRKRILNTLLIILIFRIGSHIVLPGLDTKILSDAMQKSSNSLLDLLNTLVGGGFQNASIMALAIMPYISASIAIQLLTLALPYFSKLNKEGESGRKKLNQITRWLTILVAAAQAFAYLRTQVIPTGALVVSQPFFMFYSVILLVAGTIMCMWLGERMTEKGIGNGISMMIMIGIVSRFPGAIIGEAQDKGTSGLLIFIIELVGLFLVVLFAVAITQATRRIPVQYAKQIVGNKVVTGQRQYLPLKLNIAGVMPIIFGQALMFIPSVVFNYLGTTTKNDTLIGWGSIFGNPASWQYCLLYAILIIGFTFFYTAISINPNQIADDMKRGGGFIPGIKPGQPTSDFIANVLDRITLPGGVLLAAIAILPAIAGLFGMTPSFAQFFGGTSLLILVGVVLDTLQQIESYLLMKRYEGLMKSGRIQGRTSEMATV